MPFFKRKHKKSRSFFTHNAQQFAKPQVFCSFCKKVFGDEMPAFVCETCANENGILSTVFNCASKRVLMHAQCWEKVHDVMETTGHGCRWTPFDADQNKPSPSFAPERMEDYGVSEATQARLLEKMLDCRTVIASSSSAEMFEEKSKSMSVSCTDSGSDLDDILSFSETNSSKSTSPRSPSHSTSSRRFQFDWVQLYSIELGEYVDKLTRENYTIEKVQEMNETQLEHLFGELRMVSPKQQMAFRTFLRSQQVQDLQQNSFSFEDISIDESQSTFVDIPINGQENKHGRRVNNRKEFLIDVVFPQNMAKKGLGMVIRNRGVIFSVEKGSLAQKLGVQKKWKILKINGHKTPTKHSEIGRVILKSLRRNGMVKMTFRFKYYCWRNLSTFGLQDYTSILEQRYDFDDVLKFKDRDLVDFFDNIDMTSPVEQKLFIRYLDDSTRTINGFEQKSNDSMSPRFSSTPNTLTFADIDFPGFSIETRENIINLYLKKHLIATPNTNDIIFEYPIVVKAAWFCIKLCYGKMKIFDFYSQIINLLVQTFEHDGSVPLIQEHFIVHGPLSEIIELVFEGVFVGKTGSHFVRRIIEEKFEGGSIELKKLLIESSRVLNVSEGTTQEIISSNFRNLVLKFHPDSPHKQHSLRNFLYITVMYQIALSRKNGCVVVLG